METILFVITEFHFIFKFWERKLKDSFLYIQKISNEYSAWKHSNLLIANRKKDYNWLKNKFDKFFWPLQNF